MELFNPGNGNLDERKITLEEYVAETDKIEEQLFGGTHYAISLAATEVGKYGCGMFAVLNVAGGNFVYAAAFAAASATCYLSHKKIKQITKTRTENLMAKMRTLQNKMIEQRGE